MKFHPIPLITLLLCCALQSIAQSPEHARQDDPRYQLKLFSGNISPERNVTVEKLATLEKKLHRIGNKSFVVLQFEEIPSDADRKQLLAAGIQLLDYIPERAYSAMITGGLQASMLSRFR